MRLILLVITSLLASIMISVHGHGGGLDSKGGHYNRKTGEYHYHRKAAPVPSPAPKAPARPKEVADPQTDAEIKQYLIQQSIRRYSGSCACPYNTDTAGRRCGKRSAYSKPGGASPLCYASDVTKEMVNQYKTRKNTTNTARNNSTAK